MRQIKTAYHYAIIIMVFFITLVPPAIFIFPIWSQPLRNKLINPFWKLFCKIVLFYPLRTKITSIDRRRYKNSQSGLFIVNHQSAMDIPLFSLHHQIPPIMKHEVLYIPFFGLVGVVSGAITVKRKDPDSRKKTFLKVHKRLKAGLPVQYYPEGTRTKTGQPKELKEIYKTLIDLCYKEKYPVIACSIYGTDKVLNNNGSVNKGQHLGFLTHPELYPENFSSKEEFAAAAWGSVVSGFFELEKVIRSEKN